MQAVWQSCGPVEHARSVLQEFLSHHRLLVDLVYAHQVAAEGTGIHFFLALPALNHPCVSFFPRVTAIAMSAVVGTGQELGGDAAKSTNHCLHLLNIGF